MNHVFVTFLGYIYSWLPTAFYHLISNHLLYSVIACVAALEMNYAFSLTIILVLLPWALLDP